MELSTKCTYLFTCRTFGSGVVRPFNGDAYHVRTSCSFVVTRFTHQSVQVDVTAQRGLGTLLTRAEIVINKIRTVIDQDGHITVENHRVSLPYDHTYQHIFPYGAYTRLSSTVLPLTITWHSSSQGISSLWVRLEGNSISGMHGLCGELNTPANPPKLISEAVFEDDMCVIEDSLEAYNMKCAEFMSHAMACLGMESEAYFHLCQKNAYGQPNSSPVTCSFYWQVALRCGPASSLWGVWREVTNCSKPECPGELTYQELGNAFIPTCSNPTPRASGQDMTSTCVCPEGQVLNDYAEGHQCVSVSACPCVHNSITYLPGSFRRTKCQTCECTNGRWQCSEDICPKTCSIESQFVKTFDGKHFRIPGRCSYVAAQGLNWTLTVQFSERGIKLQRVEFSVYHESYVFSHSTVMFQNQEVKDFHQTALATVFWQSSMFVQVKFLLGLSIQVQMSPEIQVYLYLPNTQRGTTEGLCGNFNGDSGDDFTTSSGIVENSAEPFALSWSLGACTPDINPICMDIDSEIFADERCQAIRDPAGAFSSCHAHVPYDRYYQACVSKTCQCQSGLHSCLCVALGNYAKACASVGVVVGDWRNTTECTVTCVANQVFDYATQVCNHTCRSLAGPDPTCDLGTAVPVEGCGCREGSYLNDHGSCSPRSQCQCHHTGGTTPPGPALVDGRACYCEDGKLNCSEACACESGHVCVHCGYFPINTALKTCDSLSKPMGSSEVCVTGCYCPDGQYEDHNGVCVSAGNCTCVFSGRVYRPGETVNSNCKSCTCTGGRWHCSGEPCPGRCQVFGNGHYQTFDHKWFRFDGNCEYTLVEDDCGSGMGTFAVRVESIPCCDEALTCSRAISVDLHGVSLVLSDMSVHLLASNSSYSSSELRYSVSSVGLYTVASAPQLGLTLIWDKHTRLTVLLEARWRGRVCGLCGDFDSSEANDLQSRGSLMLSSSLEFGNSWKTGTPPCSDVRNETFPCQRHSYCANWAQRRCMIITGDAFKQCHLKVDPTPYYEACVLEACSCEFEGKFLGFCTAVAAYAEACSEQDVCIHWRTPELCPVFCDYYNKEGRCTWHYDPCGKAKTCRNDYFKGKLEGCYPRCPAEAPYYDENTEDCTTLQNCTCLFNGTVFNHGTQLRMATENCTCTEGKMHCESPPPPTTSQPTTITIMPPTTPSTSPTTTTRGTTINHNRICDNVCNYNYNGTLHDHNNINNNTNDFKLADHRDSNNILKDNNIHRSTINTYKDNIDDYNQSYYHYSIHDQRTIKSHRASKSDNSSTSHKNNNFPVTHNCKRTYNFNYRNKAHHSVNNYLQNYLYSRILNTHTIYLGTNNCYFNNFNNIKIYHSGFSLINYGALNCSSINNYCRTHNHYNNNYRNSQLHHFVNNYYPHYHYFRTLNCNSTNYRRTYNYNHYNRGNNICGIKYHHYLINNITTTAAPTERTTVKFPTTTFPTHSTKEATTTIHMSTTTTMNPTTVAPCECRDVQRNASWACGDRWTEDCLHKQCHNSSITMTQVTCPEVPMPDCPRNQMVKVTEGCCPIYKCNCRCDVYGDPHYISFQGTAYDFLENCTYTLVQERSPQQRGFSIVVDNYFCIPWLAGSCTKGIMMTLRNHTVTLGINTAQNRVVATLDQEPVRPPYEEDGIRFETTGLLVTVHMEEIRSFVSLTPSNTLVVNLAMEHFLNNTEGQCGVCGGSSCVRPGGVIEDDSCCSKTAYDWVYPDSRKPYCTSARRNVPCRDPDSTPPPCPTQIQNHPICEILRLPEFAECGEVVDLDVLVGSCRFDVCSSRMLNTSCSVLSQAAEECKRRGYCVEWRHLTMGICDVSCPDGRVYQECRGQLDSYCCGSLSVPGRLLDEMASGCFCPEHQLRAGEHSDVCVDTCTDCKGPHGEPKQPGETWESECAVCTCNNRTKTTECQPRATLPPPICASDAMLVTGCCGAQTCVEKTCQYKGDTYQLGAHWSDPLERCVSFSCTDSGTLMERKLCPRETCTEELRIWDADHCCYSCKCRTTLACQHPPTTTTTTISYTNSDRTCGLRLAHVNLTVESCFASVQLPICEGECGHRSGWLAEGGVLQLEGVCPLCKEDTSEERVVYLTCEGHTPKPFHYRHITSCRCGTCAVQP
ncbi:mucin-5AC-like [Engraulis encrasicolus]|uniref:mucin-5AC-like n=1 Tax=Engraulis encrasicolus TaxID=184585 RepID=UPI002FD105A7